MQVKSKTIEYRNPLHFVERDLIAVRSYSFVVRGDSCAAIACAFRRPAVLQVGGDARRPERVAEVEEGESAMLRPALSPSEDIRARHRVRGDLPPGIERS